MVDVRYRQTSSLSSEGICDADRYLSVEEKARRDRLKFPADRRDYAVAHDLLRRTLSQFSDVGPAEWRFGADHYGKPFIENSIPGESPLSFSLSHTRGVVACAVADGTEVGIDVECADRTVSPLEIADRYFSPEEALQLRKYSESERRVRFAELWTLKEAYLKAVGVGLSGSLSEPSFEFREPGSIVFRVFPKTRDVSWNFTLFDIGENTRLAVAVAGKQPRVTICKEDPGIPLPVVLRTSVG
jgi:4'-phosphopantetheinyl transferase